MRLSRSLLLVLTVVVVLVLMGACGSIPTRTDTIDDTPDEAQTFAETPTPLPPAAQAAAVKAAAAVVPPNQPRPTPQGETYKGCPPGGDGTDAELNTLKNRIDSPAQPLPLSFTSLETLPWPRGIDKKHMQSWAPADRTEVMRFNGLGVVVEAYLIMVKGEAGESNNCHSTAPEDVDFHVWIVGNATDDRPKSIVVEINPRLRAKHTDWTLAHLREIANARPHVRITGWVMLDPEHPDQVGKTRGTIWEIHPITKIETDKGGGQWQTIP